MQLIADIGSCWGNNTKDAMRCIKLLADLDIEYIKFQLCDPVNGNKPIPDKALPYLVSYGADLGCKVSASIWNSQGAQTLIDADAEWVKFAHSASNKYSLINNTIEHFEKTFVTVPLMEQYEYPESIIKLWTYETNGVPVYPVTCKIHHLNMPYKYDGFSCHHIDYTTIFQLNIHDNPYEWVEFHANPLGVRDVPDAAFAYLLYEIEDLADDINNRS